MQTHSSVFPSRFQVRIDISVAPRFTRLEEDVGVSVFLMGECLHLRIKLLVHSCGVQLVEGGEIILPEREHQAVSPSF